MNAGSTWTEEVEVDLLFDMMTGVGLAAIAGLLLFCYVTLSRDPRERRR